MTEKETTFQMTKAAALALCDIAAGSSDDIEDGYLGEDFLVQVAAALEERDAAAMERLRSHATIVGTNPAVVAGLETLIHSRSA